MKSRHNIYLAGKSMLSENMINIRGNKLNCRWFDKCLLVWSEQDNKEPLPKKCLEIIEAAFQAKSPPQNSEGKPQEAKLPDGFENRRFSQA